MSTSQSRPPFASPSSPYAARARAAILAVSASLITSVAYSGLVATDTSVPRVMDQGGTAGDPARYVIGLNGPVSHSSTWDVTVGEYRSHNELLIRNGSSYTVHNDGGMIGWESDHNTVTVSGPGSRWILGGTSGMLTVGWNGSHNRLVVENGGLVSNGWSAEIGRGENSRHNSVLITGPGSRWESEPVSLDGGGHNSIVIENGGVLTTTYGFSWIGKFEDAPQNSVHVTGPGSAWFNDGGLFISESQGNTLTIENGGLVTLQTHFGFEVDASTDNHVRLNGGFLALSGDQINLLETLIADGAFQLWNGTEWVTGDASSFTYGYFSYANETAAELLTGHKDLGNFTIITAAYVAPIPEPAAFAALAGLGALTLCGTRRGRRLR